MLVNAIGEANNHWQRLKAIQLLGCSRSQFAKGFGTSEHTKPSGSFNLILTVTTSIRDERNVINKDETTSTIKLLSCFMMSVVASLWADADDDVVGVFVVGVVGVVVGERSSPFSTLTEDRIDT